MSVDGTDLSKITGEIVKDVAVAAAPIVIRKGGWFISHIAALALAIIMPVVGFFIGRGVERAATPVVAAVSAGSGSGSAGTAASGSAAAPEVRTIPYDAKTVAADAVVGRPEGTGMAPTVPDTTRDFEADAK